MSRREGTKLRIGMYTTVGERCGIADRRTRRLREARRRHVESRYAWDLAVDALERTHAGAADGAARAPGP